MPTTSPSEVSVLERTTRLFEVIYVACIPSPDYTQLVTHTFINSTRTTHSKTFSRAQIYIVLYIHREAYVLCALATTRQRRTLHTTYIYGGCRNAC